MKRMYLLGAGPDGKTWLTVEAASILETCDLLLGAERLIAAHAGHPAPKVVAVAVRDMEAALEAHPQAQRIAVLLSGDIGFYSGAKRLREAFAKRDLEMILLPGISAHQLLCARLGISWEDALLTSVHGRTQDVCAQALNHAKILALAGSNMPPEAVCEALAKGGLGFVRVTVGELLGYPQERIRSGTADELQSRSFDPLSVLLIENDRPLSSFPLTAGLPDEAFDRAGAPMTKREVRAVSIAQMDLRPADVVWDIGAGTGSVALECALLCRLGRVFAVEREAEACEGIARNREKFGAWHLRVVSGEAPDVLEDLPAPDRVFVGGSGGRLREILRVVRKANPKARVVVNAITLETFTEALEALAPPEFKDLEVTQVSAARARPVGAYHMMTAQNPVFILAANGAAEESV